MMARCVAVLCAAGWLIGAGTASADQSLHATGAVTSGYTTNVLGVPDTDEEVARSDAFVSITPGILYSYEAPRYRVVARYSLGARLFLTESEGNSFSNVLSFRGSGDINPTSQLELSVAGSAGRINAFAGDPEQAEAGLQPNGDLAYARALGSVAYTKQFSPIWTLRQIVDASAFTPTDETTSINTNYNFGGRAALERRWRRHSVTGQFETRYSHNEQIDDNTGERIDPDLNVVLGPRARWLWDISGRFSSAVSVGVTRVFDPESPEMGIWQPQFTAQISHLKNRSIVSLRYIHDVQTNTLVGQTSTVDRVELRGNYPTEEILENSGVSGTIAAQRGRQIDLDDESLSASSSQGIVDVAATWLQYEGLAWAARYQYSRARRGIPVLGSTADLSGHQFQLIMTIRYPDRQAVELPERPADRVDQDDDEELQRGDTRR